MKVPYHREKKLKRRAKYDSKQKGIDEQSS
jgi:hypothetical protein